MLLGLLTLITALSISAVAIYYSVAGLVAIFAAAAVPIMIMGGVLEVSKLVTAVWLHRYWKQATWWLRAYLSTAVVVLMLITSMGIFGFLSKAHIEQTSASTESVARAEILQKEIDRNIGIVGRAENRIRDLENSSTGVDANIQSQIDKEQERIDKAFERIQPAIDQQNKIIEDARTTDNTRTKPYEDQLSSIQAEILRLESSAREYEDKIASLGADTSAVQPLLDQIKSIEDEIIRVTNQLQSREQAQIRAGQAIIGVTSDGLFGNNTREALAKWVSAQQDRIAQIQSDISQLRKDATATVDAERVRLADVVKDIRTVQIPALKERELTMLGKIDEVRQTESPVIQTARDEIQRLRKSAEDQVAQSQTLITRLQQQLANTDNTAQIQKDIDEQNERIRTASSEIEKLTQEKIQVEAEYRKLEAEVGPIKYIAEFIYGDEADKNMLEEAVRWVIITIIFVFDPLAVLLLIASQYTFEFNRRKDDDGGWLRRYEQARAQRIVDNPGFNIDDSKEASDEDRKEDSREEQQDAEELRDGQDEESIQAEAGHDSDVAETSQEERSINDIANDYIRTDDAMGDVVPEADTTVADEVDAGLEQSEVQTDEQDTQVDSKKKNDTESSGESRLSEQELDEREALPEWQDAKTRWKADHPNLTLKTYKQLYLDGKIDALPWEDYVKKSYIMKNKDQQIKKETLVKPEFTEVIEPEGYIQNSEQNESTLWKRLKDGQ
jgi:hypothetical protein